ncbi:hypothetical protein MTP99_004866 [Tenebrio molitor]|nr:hypothetical protein MTP99_004866 [Tenebrio molitor]
MLAAGVIERSVSDYCSPAVLVTKEYGAHFVNRHSGSDREGGCNKKTLNHFELLLPRGPCVGTIAQPPLASHKNLTSSSSTNRGVPVLAQSTSHPSYQRPSTRGPCASTVVQPPLVKPLQLATVVAPRRSVAPRGFHRPVALRPPWRSAPLGLRPGDEDVPP